MQKIPDKTYIIAISSIGSGIGQSVIRSCRISNLPLHTVGLGNNPFAYGAYDCDEYDYLPSIYSKEYIRALIKKCHQYKIDLLIPGLDEEILLLSKNEHALDEAGISVILAENKIIELSRDKEKMSKELNGAMSLFVKSFNKSNIHEALDSQEVHYPLLAKPKSGFASRGVQIINHTGDLDEIPYDYVIQELARPAPDDPNYAHYNNQISKNINPQVSEISIQLVSDCEGKLMGKMVSYNKLKNGVPIEILPISNLHVWEKVDELIPQLKDLGMRGPLNIQGRITENGIKLFEMNPRFTGITHLRALMGFNEVEACIKNWLHIDSPASTLSVNYDRFGIRQTEEKAISLSQNKRIQNLSQKLNHQTVNNPKTLLITGADGFLGQTLISMITDQSGPYTLYALVRNKQRLGPLGESNKNIRYFDYTDLQHGLFSLSQVDILIHGAFAREKNSLREITSSLKLANELLTAAALNQVPQIINISSKSIYGKSTDTILDENHSPYPNSLYALAKFASEQIASSLTKFNQQTYVTSLRFASLCGGKAGIQKEELIAQFVKQVLNKQPIHIIGGQQTFEKMDVRDAATAILSLLKTPPRRWKKIYNVTGENSLSIMDIAQRVIDLGQEYNGGFRSKITLKPKHTNIQTNIKSTQFKKDTGWVPQYSLDDIITSLFEYFIKTGQHQQIYSRR